MSSSKPKAKIPTYYMSIHFGLCHGPVDKLKAIYCGEKQAWKGNVTSNTTLSIDKENLFGGIDKEGGLKGVCEVMFGGSFQTASSALAQRLGGTPSTVPGFRGIMSVFFRGSGNPRGFYWAASSPYLKELWFTIQNIPRSLAWEYAEVPRQVPNGDGTYTTIDSDLDANPAHIIYECLTNTDWGLGEAPERIDQAAFFNAAQTLYNERLGLSLIWAQSGSVETFVNDILGHINGVLFTHPRTGLLTIRLIRDDYNVDNLRTINPDNARLTSFSRKAWGETVNEMKVTWTNPASEKEETVYSQDLGNIALQGAVISDSRNYHGVRSAAMAQKLCDRELRVASSPLCSAEVELDRSFWDITPYEVLKLDWPEYGINGLIVRAVEVSYGTRKNPTIKVSLLEDVFSLPQVAFTSPAGSEWVDPGQPPLPAQTIRMLPLPAYSLAQEGVAISSLEYPSTYAGLLVESPYTQGSALYNVYVKEADPNGGMDWVLEVTGGSFAGKGTLVTTLPAGATTTIQAPANVTGQQPDANCFLIIGSDSTPVADMELALVQSVDPLNGNLTLLRGVLDTVPKTWPVGTPVWIVSVDLFDPIPLELTAGQTLEVRVETHTSIGQTDAAESPVRSGTIGSRATKPLRPANVKVNGADFEEAELDTSLVLTWNHRNRLLEDRQILSWTAASTTPEAGVSYRVEIDALDSAGGVISAKWVDTDVGTAVTYSHDLTENPPPSGTAKLRCRVAAERDGERSWQAFEVTGVLINPIP